jgi:hypothetical protein
MNIVFEDKKDFVLPPVPFVVKENENYYIVSEIVNHTDSFALVALNNKLKGICFDDNMERDSKWLKQCIENGIYKILDATLTIKTS